MFDFIFHINGLIQQFYEHLNSIKLRQTFFVFCLTGMLAGFILSLFSSIERLYAFGTGISLFNKISAILFSSSTLIMLGLFLSIFAFLAFVLSIKLFILFCKISKSMDTLQPYKVIIFLSVLNAGLLTYFFSAIFIDDNNSIFEGFLQYNQIFNYLFIVLFLIIAAMCLSLVIYVIKNSAKIDNKPAQHPFKIILFTISGLIFLYFLYSIFSNTPEPDTFQGKFLSFFADNLILFKINLFITLVLTNLFISYLSILFIAKVIKIKNIQIVAVVISLILFVFIYFAAQNIFTNQLFFKYLMSLIIILIALTAFYSLQFALYILLRHFSNNYTSFQISKKTAGILIIIYLIIFSFSHIVFNQSNALRAFIYRHCTYEKIALEWPVLFSLKKKLPAIKPELTGKGTSLIMSPVNNQPEQKPDIILIIVDSLRNESVQDSLTDKSSFFHDFSVNSFNFINAYSHSTYTLAAMSPVFTSRSYSSIADIANITLAEILLSNGYVTYSLNNFKKVYKFDSIILKNKKTPSLFSKGFQIIDKTDNEAFRALKDRAITYKFLSFLKKRDSEQPLFAYIHYSELHLINPSIIIHNITSGNNFKETYNRAFREEGENLKLLIQGLKKLNKYNDSLIIITSDHGESAKEHGDLFHVFGTYQENVRVPLFVKLPGQKSGKVVKDSLSHLDITPTLIDYIGNDLTNADFDGQSFLNVLTSKSYQSKNILIALSMFQTPGSYHYSLYGEPDNYNKSVIEVAVIDKNNEWKAIYNLFFNFKELYNLKSDPKEQKNLIDDNYDKAKELLMTVKIPE